MATYTRNKTIKPPAGKISTTQELAKSVAQKEATVKAPPMAGKPASPLAGAVPAKELKPAGKSPIPEDFKLDQTGKQTFGGGGPIKDQLDMAKTGATTGNLTDKLRDQTTISPLESPEAKAEREKREKEAALAAAEAEAKREMETKAKNNAAELEANADLNGDGVIGTGIEGMAGGRQMTEQDAINTAIRNLITEQPDVAEERKAMIGEMEAKEARDIQSMRARTGLGGMGLTGAAGALESQVRQESGREQALTTAQFDRAARQEALDRLLKGIETRRGERVAGLEERLAEEELGEDIDGDGLVGNKPVAEFEKTSKYAEQYGGYYSEAQANPASAVKSGNRLSVSGDQPGTWQNGEYSVVAELNNIPGPRENKGFVMVGEEVYALYEGSDGKKYTRLIKKPD